MAGTLEDEQAMLGEEEGPGGSAAPAKAKKASEAGSSTSYSGRLSKELRGMLFGFGDEAVPYEETVEVLEELVVEFVREVTLAGLAVGKADRVAIEDVWYLIRRDQKKYARVKDLLTMSEELRKARKAFDDKLT